MFDVESLNNRAHQIAALHEPSCQVEQTHHRIQRMCKKFSRS